LPTADVQAVRRHDDAETAVMSRIGGLASPDMPDTSSGDITARQPFEFRRITNLPPYVFTIINGLKIDARQHGVDVVDLGFGNPDIPSPPIAVEKLAEAAHNTRNHRYSLSRGIPKLREAFANLYKRTWDVDLDPETEVINTIGSKEGFSHLMWVLLDRGDAAIVPSPSYPIHIYGPLFAGADLRQVPMSAVSAKAGDADYAESFFGALHNAWDIGWPKPRVIVVSFPHNPTGTCVDLAFMQRLVDFARERGVIVVHDFAYADVGFDGYQPPSILQADGAKECAVELYSMTKSFSMAGWRVAGMAGNRDVIAALAKLKSYLDYGSFQPIQIAATVTMNEASEYPREVCGIYESRRDALVDGLARIGWDIPKPQGTMFVWAPIPEPYQEMGSLEFAAYLVKECEVALSPGVGFGPGGDAFIRFALIENEQRIAQAIRNLKRGLTKL
jgi:alanine-synthesizing transaminase